MKAEDGTSQKLTYQLVLQRIPETALLRHSSIELFVVMLSQLKPTSCNLPVYDVHTLSSRLLSKY